MSMAQGMEQGFADAVMSSQATFRAVLNAMARPGSIAAATAEIGVPRGLAPATASLALTLFDHDTPVWRDEALNDEELARWLRFHTGAPLTGDPGRAAFALIGDVAAFSDLGRFSIGTAEYPDRSTTFIFQVDTLTAGDPLVLTGPGIKDMADFAPSPLPKNFLSLIAANNGLFPQGHDFIFCAGERISALSRTTRIRQKEA